MRIVEARLPAADPEALTAWYSGHVGAAPTFVPGEAAPHHFAFHVAGFDAWRGRLDLTDEYDFSSWGEARSVYFRDPEGNVGELVARPQPQRQPELSLAEVGLPVDDVPAAVDALKTLGMLPYREPHPEFAPVGDEEGLLIVVRVGRGWFPVGEPAGAAPIELVVEGAGRGELEVPGSSHRVLAVG